MKVETVAGNVGFRGRTKLAVTSTKSRSKPPFYSSLHVLARPFFSFVCFYVSFWIQFLQLRDETKGKEDRKLFG